MLKCNANHRRPKTNHLSSGPPLQHPCLISVPTNVQPAVKNHFQALVQGYTDEWARPGVVKSPESNEETTAPWVTETERGAWIAVLGPKAQVAGQSESRMPSGSVYYYLETPPSMGFFLTPGFSSQTWQETSSSYSLEGATEPNISRIQWMREETLALLCRLTQLFKHAVQPTC